MNWSKQFENYNLRIYQEKQHSLKLREEERNLKAYKQFVRTQKAKEKRVLFYAKLKTFLRGDF
jgi:hypothetical protein